MTQISLLQYNQNETDFYSLVLRSLSESKHGHLRIVNESADELVQVIISNILAEKQAIGNNPTKNYHKVKIHSSFTHPEWPEYKLPNFILV